MARHRTKWTLVAQEVDRTPAACRLKWEHLSDESDVGKWKFDEVERLKEGFRLYSNKWALVASVVRTRSARQCRKQVYALQSGMAHSLPPDLVLYTRTYWQNHYKTYPVQDHDLILGYTDSLTPLVCSCPHPRSPSHTV